jgi:hypothetical protein
VTFHDLRVPYLFPKAGPLRRWIVYHLARSAEGVIATNDEDFHRLLTEARPRRLALIPIGSNIPCAPPPGYDRPPSGPAGAWGPTTSSWATSAS